jgi:hypothetical protein
LFSAPRTPAAVAIRFGERPRPRLGTHHRRGSPRTGCLGAHPRRGSPRTGFPAHRPCGPSYAPAPLSCLCPHERHASRRIRHFSSLHQFSIFPRIPLPASGIIRGSPRAGRRRRPIPSRSCRLRIPPPSRPAICKRSSRGPSRSSRTPTSPPPGIPGRARSNERAGRRPSTSPTICSPTPSSSG